MVVCQVSFSSPILQFEKSVQHNLDIFSGRGELGEQLKQALQFASDYGELHVVEGLVNRRGEITKILSAEKSAQSGPAPSATTTSTSDLKVSLLLDSRHSGVTVDVITPAELEPEARAVIWETTKRFRNPIKEAA